jgi:long-subunit fatty acid transport protein
MYYKYISVYQQYNKLLAGVRVQILVILHRVTNPLDKMRKPITFLLALIACQMVIAGGIITNTNQSAMYTRMQIRDATLGIDAVYFNPAGLTLLPNDGFYLSLNNQTLGQTRTVNTDYEYLNQSEYIGKVSAPFFPGIYAAWKSGNMTVSAGFNPIGGGGGAAYDKGLPSFEYSPSDLVPGLQQSGMDARSYRLNASFEGTSVFFGYQANFSYQINDFISVAIGGRFVTAKETYKGHLRDIQLNLGGLWMPASGYFNSIAEGTGAAAESMQQLVDGGAGAMTLAQAEANSVITAEQRAQLEAGLTAMGADPSSLTIEQGQTVYAQAEATAAGTAYLLGDQEVEAEKTASGITPVISVNISPTEKMNIALKYEFNTKLEFTNKTTSDVTTGFDENGAPVTMFPDGAKSRLDIPAQLAIGITYQLMDPLLISTGFHYYFDENADWNDREKSLDGNAIELGLGLEYVLSEKFLVSAGYLYTKSGATGEYQTDLSYSLPSNSVGGGFAYQVLPLLEVNLGGSYTMYQTGDKTFNHDLAGSGFLVPVTETFDKDVWIVSLGLNFNFGSR